MISTPAAGSDPDVIVIGGGPSGATASTILAQHGHRVQLFEREHFPRFHIGESLIPETYWVLERIGMLPKMKASHFVKKYSVQFVGQSGRLSEPFYFEENKQHESSQTWQVVRSEFDKMMLDNAREHGVDVHEGVRVLEVLFENDQAVGVRLMNEDGTKRDVRSRVVIDASGQSALLQHRFKLRVDDPELRKGALWTYYEGAYRDTGRNAGATMVLQTKEKKGWFWYIPQHNNIVSVGVVADFDYLLDKSRGDLETIFNQELDNCPAAKERVAIGKRVSPFHVQKEYTYRSSKLSGDGWVLVGDAFGFLDPLYSSGVLLALRSGMLAADAVSEGLKTGDVSAAQLGKWGPDFKKGMDRMRRMVCEYYDGFSFGRFVKKHPDLKGHLTDLLIGDLFDDKVDDVVAPMDAIKQEMAAARKSPA